MNKSILFPINTSPKKQFRENLHQTTLNYKCNCQLSFENHSHSDFLEIIKETNDQKDWKCNNKIINEQEEKNIKTQNHSDQLFQDEDVNNEARDMEIFELEKTLASVRFSKMICLY